AGGVQPGDLGAAPVQLEQGLFGKYGDAPGPFQAVGVQKGVPVVHTAQAADGPGAVQHRFGQGGLARVHMGQHPHHQAFCRVLHGRPPYKMLAAMPMAVIGTPTSRLASILHRAFSSLLSSSKETIFSSAKSAIEWVAWRLRAPRASPRPFFLSRKGTRTPSSRR